MKIIIDIGEKEMEATPTVIAAVPTPPDAMDAGAAASSEVADSLGEDAGAPPAWLLEAVGRAELAEDITLVGKADSEDAGPGPA